MDLHDRTTWPDDLIQQLERDRAVFEGWELRRIGAPGARPVSGPDYDGALARLRAVLRNYALHGYHCTRITPGEIAHILSAGMHLPNEMVLRQRIETLRESGLVDAGTAADLIAENQAAETNRAGRIWFCFFPPRLAGESGISSLLRYWGGEALYNSHDEHPLRGPLLARLGTPCLVEANVPITNLRGPGFLDIKIARQFLIWNGLQTTETVDHEDCAVRPLTAANILRIIEFPDRDFITLTGCDNWRKPWPEL
jgi:hypothetical protein